MERRRVAERESVCVGEGKGERGRDGARMSSPSMQAAL